MDTCVHIIIGKDPCCWSVTEIDMKNFVLWRTTVYSQMCTDVSEKTSVSYQMLVLTDQHCTFKVLHHASQRGDHGYLKRWPRIFKEVVTDI